MNYQLICLRRLILSKALNDHMTWKRFFGDIHEAVISVFVKLLVFHVIADFYHNIF